MGAAEPVDRVDSLGTIYVESIRGVPRGIDLWRWNASIDGVANPNGASPTKELSRPASAPDRLIEKSSGHVRAVSHAAWRFGPAT